MSSQVVKEGLSTTPQEESDCIQLIAAENARKYMEADERAEERTTTMLEEMADKYKAQQLQK